MISENDDLFEESPLGDELVSMLDQSIADKKLEAELLIILLAFLHEWPSIPIFKRNAALVKMRKQLEVVTKKALYVVRDEILMDLPYPPHLRVLERFQELYPGHVFTIPSETLPELLFAGRTVKEQFLFLGGGLPRRLMDQFRKNQDPMKALTTSFKSWKASVVSYLETVALHRDRLAEYLFFKANPEFFTKVKFIAVMDGRTSKICRSLHGRVFNVQDDNIPVPPLHVRCRSRLIPIIGENK